MHGRNQKADLLSEFSTDTANPAQQLAILRFVDQRNQAITHFQAKYVKRCDVRPARLLCLGRCGRNRRRLDGDGFLLPLLLSGCFPGQITKSTSEEQKDEIGHARHKPEQADDGAGQTQHLGIVEKLCEKLLRQVLIIANAGDHHAGRDGNDQGRDLRHQTVADGQQRVGFRGGSEIQIMLQHANE